MFKTQLILGEWSADNWVLEAPLCWNDPVFGTLTFPVGFITDLESIPFSIRAVPFLDIEGLTRRPSAAHDGLYRLCRSRGKDYADRFLRAAMLAEGASEGTAATVYYGVRWGGGEAWEDDDANVTDFDTETHYVAWRATAP